MAVGAPVFPPVVYVPILVDGDRQQLSMSELADGRTALFCYSALDRLLDMFASDAPWILLTVQDLQRAHDECPFDVLLLDRRPTSVREPHA